MVGKHLSLVLFFVPCLLQVYQPWLASSCLVPRASCLSTSIPINQKLEWLQSLWLKCFGNRYIIMQNLVTVNINQFV